MSNNKQSMKLYTEEQVHSAILLALGRHGIYIPNKHYQDLIDLLTPIELPSDVNKEIFYHKQIMNPYCVEDYAYTAYEKGFIEGSQVVINKIQGGNK